MTSSSHARERILFAGLGVMGLPMAAHLAEDRAHELRVYDIQPERRDEFARTANVEAVSGVGTDWPTVVILMLPDSSAVTDLLTGQGLLEELRPGALVIDMGSSAPHSTIRLAGAAAERGVTLIDAPVSGGRRGAEAATLSIMAGGEPEAFRRARPLLARMGSRVTHVGAAGAGHALKALNNLLAATGIAAAAEALSVGAKFGLEPAVMLDVINSSTGRNHATETKFGRFVLSGDFNSAFSLGLMLKDIETAIDIGHTEGIVMPVSEAAVHAARSARAEFGYSADHLRLATWISRVAGVTLHSEERE